MADNGIQIADTLENGIKASWISGCSRGEIFSENLWTKLFCDTAGVTSASNARFATDKTDMSGGVDISFAFSISKSGTQTVNRYVRLVDVDNIESNPSAYAELANIKNNSIYIGDTEISKEPLADDTEYVMFIHMDDEFYCTVWLDGKKLNSESVKASMSGTVGIDNARVMFNLMSARKKDVTAGWNLKNLSVSTKKHTELSCNLIDDGILNQTDVTSITVFTGAMQKNVSNVELSDKDGVIELESYKNYGGIFEVSFRQPLEENVVYTLNINGALLTFVTLPKGYVRPTVSILSDLSSVYVGDSFSFEVTAEGGSSEIDKVEIYLNNDLVECTKNESTYSFTVQSEGDKTVYAVAYDAMGINAKSESITFSALKRLPPQVSVSFEDKTYREDETVTVTAQASSLYGDINRVEFYLNNVLEGIADEEPFQYDIKLALGENEIYAIVYDDYNSGKSETRVINAAERLKPQLKVIGLENGIILKKNLEKCVLDIEYDGEISDVEFYLDGKKCEMSDDMYTYSAPADTCGEHVLHIDITAADGNYLEFDEKIKVIDSAEQVNCIYDWDENMDGTVWYQDNYGIISQDDFGGEHKTVERFSVSEEGVGKDGVAGPIFNTNTTADENGIIDVRFDIYRDSYSSYGNLSLKMTGNKWGTLISFKDSAIRMCQGEIEFPINTWATIHTVTNFINKTIHEEVYIGGKLEGMCDVTFEQAGIDGLYSDGSLRIYTFFNHTSAIGDSVYLDNIAVSGTEASAFVKSIEDIDYTSSCVNVEMSKVMGINRADAAELKSECGTVTVSKIEADGKILKIYPRDGFDSAQKYTLLLKSEMLLEGNTSTIGNDIICSFSTSAKDTDLISGAELPDGSGVKMVFNNGAPEQKYVCVIISVFENDKFKMFRKYDVTLEAYKNKTVILKYPEADKDAKFKVFAIRDISERIPIANKMLLFN